MDDDQLPPDSPDERGEASEWATPGVVFERSSLTAELDAEIAEALAQMDAGRRRLAQLSQRGDLLALGPDALIEFGRALEAHRTKIAAIDPYVVEAAEVHNLPERQCTRSVASALAEVLRISPATASARVALAHQVLPSNNLSGEPTAETFPALRDALDDGAVTCDQVAVIASALRRISDHPHVDAETIGQAEASLLEHAAAFGPRELKRLAVKIEDVLLPDGTLPDERISEARRALNIGPQRRDGTHELTGFLTRTAAARLQAVLSPLSAPRPSDDLAGADTRTPEQRRHDGLEDAMSRLLDRPDLPRSGGTPATVHLMLDTDAVLDGADRVSETGHVAGFTVADSAVRQASTGCVGETSDGVRLSLGDVLTLGDQSLVVPVWARAWGEVLDYGRQRRLASEGQTNALIARDKGCSFPGCEAPPDWCERHHVLEWLFGGTTDLTNLTLLCGFHHREFERRGWQVVIYQGIPTWIPPSHLDPEQQPLINVRISGGASLPIDRDEVHAMARDLRDRRYSGRAAMFSAA